MTSVIVWCSTGSRPTPPGNSVVAARSAHLFDGAVACGPSNPRRQFLPQASGWASPASRSGHCPPSPIEASPRKLVADDYAINHSITCLFRHRRRRLRSIAGNLIRAIDGDVTERSTAQFPPPPSRCTGGTELGGESWMHARVPTVGWLLRCSAFGMCVIAMNYRTLSPAYPTTISALTIVMHGLQRRAQKRCFNFRQIKLLLLLTLTCC